MGNILKIKKGNFSYIFKMSIKSQLSIRKKKKEKTITPTRHLELLHILTVVGVPIKKIKICFRTI